MPEVGVPQSRRFRHGSKAAQTHVRRQNDEEAGTVSRLIQQGGWETLAHLYSAPSNYSGNQGSVGFHLERRNERPKLRAYGAARQLIEESRSIFLSNLTNLVNSAAIARQFFEKADEDNDGVVTRAQFRKWVRSMMTADAYAGLDHEQQVAEVLSRALDSTPDFETRVAPFLDRASRRRGVGITRDGDGPFLAAPPESWVQTGSKPTAGADSDDTPSEVGDDAHEIISDSADSTGTLTPTSSSSSDDDLAVGFASGTCAGDPERVDPDSPVPFERFKKAVEALSLKTLLRTDGVRLEVPVSEDPPLQRVQTVVAPQGQYPTLWDEGGADWDSQSKSKVRKAWENAYASGKNCIWVVPEPDQDVRRVLAEGWFDAKGICVELGCGLGYDSAALAEAGFEVIGVDISATAIAAARAMAEGKGLQERLRFLCGDAYEMPAPTKPVALIWDNTLYQNAHRGDRLGAKWKYNSARYKELLLRLTVPGSLVLLNVMSSELTESHLKLAERGFNLPLTSAMRLVMEFVEFFEFIFFRNGIYDMNSLFIDEASKIGYQKPALLGGLPSWCVLMRRREVPKAYIPTLPLQEPFVVASQVLARDGFKKPPPPLFLRRLVEEEWGENWGEGPKSGLALTSGGGHRDDDGDNNAEDDASVRGLAGQEALLAARDECWEVLDAEASPGQEPEVCALEQVLEAIRLAGPECETHEVITFHLQEESDGKATGLDSCQGMPVHWEGVD